MTDNMAKAFFEMWQKQLEATVKEPDVAESMLSLMFEWQKNMLAAKEMMGKSGVVNSAETPNNPFYDPALFKAFTPTGLNIPERGNDKLDDVIASLSALEARLTEIEKKLGDRKPRSKPAKSNKRSAK